MIHPCTGPHMVLRPHDEDRPYNAAEPSPPFKPQRRASCLISQRERNGRVRGLGDPAEEVDSASLPLFLALEWFPAALESTGCGAAARISATLLALLDHLQFETAILAGVDLSHPHLVTICHARQSPF